MEINRNQYFMAGMVILFLGIQLRLVDSYVLNDKCSEVIAKRMRNAPAAEMAATSLLPQAIRPVPKHTITPPTWIGWALLSAGGVLILHSLAMKKPGG